VGAQAAGGGGETAAAVAAVAMVRRAGVAGAETGGGGVEGAAGEVACELRPDAAVCFSLRKSVAGRAWLDRLYVAARPGGCSLYRVWRDWGAFGLA